MDKKKPLYNLPTPNKIVGKRINKTRQGHSKIYKNLSQIPIEIHLEGKQNQSIGSINRPHSSINQQQPHKNLRIDSALSHYAQPNKKRLSLDSTNKRHERDSLMSRNSISKKPSKNQIVIDDSTKLKLAEDRRRYNSSCGSAIDDKRTETRKKMSQKTKRPSINNLQIIRKDAEKSQNVRKEEKSLIIRDKTDKSKSKSKNKKKRKQSTTQLDKSKASTSAIAFIKPDKTDKKFLKKKQSLSTAVINLPPREKKKKMGKKNSQKVEIVEENSQSEYPINKYEAQPQIKKGRNQSSSKPKSKGRKGSAGKERHKKTYSLIEQIDYASCINIPSNSSGLINSLSHSSHNSSKIKIIDNWEYRYITDENPTSVNLEQIRFYEEHINARSQNEAEFISRNFNNAHHYHKRKKIQMEISEDYPNFNELELKFLASVMFIQRKWRQYRLYKDIFQNFGNHQGLPSFIEKSNSKQLNISNGPKSAQKATTKHTTQIQSAQVAPFADSLVLSPQQPQRKIKQYRQECHQDLLVTQLNNQTYLEQRQIRGNERPCFQMEANKFHEYEQQRKSSSSKEFCLKSHRYQFLQSEIFPNINYLILKKEELKEELHRKLAEITQLQRNQALFYDQYIKLKNQYERQYQRRLKDLNRSKQDITKGYLKFIDTYKDIKHEALRKVSSESGLMANMYRKVFNFDQHHITTPSNSSESLKKLAKKMLIRKEFYHTQKLQPFIFNTYLIENNKNLSERLHSPTEEHFDLSARCFRSKREQRGRQQEQNNQKNQLFIDLQSLSNERMQNKRIKQGYAVSPQFQQGQNSQNMILTFTKSDELLPITIKSPKDYNHPTEEALPQNYERKERVLMQEVIASLTHQLYVQLVSIDEKRQSLLSFSPEQEKIKYMHVTDLEMIDEGRSGGSSREDKSDEIEIVEEEKFREIYKIEGLQDRSSENSQRKHRNSKEYNISPASSQKIAFDCDDIVTYAQSFIDFLQKNNVVEEIIVKLNKNQGFTPLEYLKFLRDFQIPDDQYDPLISNQIFIDWEDFFTNKYYPLKNQENVEAFVARQSVTIFHRCIFQSIIFLLQEYRPCGEKGMPFPWQKVIFFPRVISRFNIDGIFKKCVSKLQEILKVSCGIIDEKYFVYNQEDLQRIHEQNEDKIINMLEKELGESPHNWYQVEEHCLEIKLELQCEIMEYLMLEALDEVLQNY